MKFYVNYAEYPEFLCACPVGIENNSMGVSEDQGTPKEWSHHAFEPEFKPLSLQNDSISMHTSVSEKKGIPPIGK